MSKAYVVIDIMSDEDAENSILGVASSLEKAFDLCVKTINEFNSIDEEDVYDVPKGIENFNKDDFGYWYQYYANENDWDVIRIQEFEME